MIWMHFLHSVLPVLCVTPSPYLLSFSLTEMMCYLTKIQLDELCFLAQTLPIHQILFQPFISRKFCSLPKGLPQLEGTCGTEWSSSSSAKPAARARPAAHREQEGRGDTALLAFPSCCMQELCSPRRQEFVRPAAAFPPTPTCAELSSPPLCQLNPGNLELPPAHWEGSETGPSPGGFTGRNPPTHQFPCVQESPRCCGTTSSAFPTLPKCH